MQILTRMGKVRMMSVLIKVTYLTRIRLDGFLFFITLFLFFIIFIILLKLINLFQKFLLNNMLYLLKFLKFTLSIKYLLIMYNDDVFLFEHLFAIFIQIFKLTNPIK